MLEIFFFFEIEFSVKSEDRNLIYKPHYPFIFIGVACSVYQCRIYILNFNIVIHTSSEITCSFIVQVQLRRQHLARLFFKITDYVYCESGFTRLRQL